MEAEKVMELFESVWFDFQILSKKSNFEANPLHQVPIHQDPSKKLESKAKMYNPRKHKRSKSHDHVMTSSSKTCSSSSPDSVLTSSPKLKLLTIPSGKEISEESYYYKTDHQPAVVEIIKNVKKSSKNNNNSKSLSELEFEELKGFMDLGFIFSEEDNKDSRLVEIIPGLHRLLGNDHQSIKLVSRPYLSEKWEIFETKNNRNIINISPLKDWKLPTNNSSHGDGDGDGDIGIKDNLKSWAHFVASSVISH
ncbi:hypothetical protein ACFE04_027556 [Oxalis oulophora]